ncbi:hypothetical protein D3C87_1693030 [compost metagenome]
MPLGLHARTDWNLFGPKRIADPPRGLKADGHIRFIFFYKFTERGERAFRIFFRKLDVLTFWIGVIGNKAQAFSDDPFDLMTL